MKFLSQPMLLEVEPPIYVCGDIHGQYHDLLQLFKSGGYPPTEKYLFLGSWRVYSLVVNARLVFMYTLYSGDYVDRGRHGIETICLLFAYKVEYPERMYLLRGNHETESVTRVYGFFDECKRRFLFFFISNCRVCSCFNKEVINRYNPTLYKTFIDSFDCMPVAAVIDERIFCCHGGLSPELRSMDQIRSIIRPVEVGDHGLICDLLWSDPDKEIMGWGNNERGVSFTFGE